MLLNKAETKNHVCQFRDAERLILFQETGNEDAQLCCHKQATIEACAEDPVTLQYKVAIQKPLLYI